MNIDGFQRFPWFIWLEVGFFLSACIIVSGGALLAWWKLAYMEDLLDKCTMVQPNKKYWGNTPHGVMFRMAAVFSATTFVKLNDRRGVIDTDQVKSFPTYLKRSVQAYYLSLAVFIAAIFIYKVFIKK